MRKDHDQIREIFEHELLVIEKGKQYMVEESFRENPLQDQYEDLLFQYEKLLKLSKKIFKISDLQGRILKKREYEIKHLLDNSSQGFLTFGKDLLVHKEYSAKCVDIFCRRIEGAYIIDLLGLEDLIVIQTYKNSLESIFSSLQEKERRANIAQLPVILWINNRSINLEFKWVEDPNDEQDGVIMLILTDITETLEARDRVEYLSYHDPVTSLFNRAYIETIVPNLFGPSYYPLSVIMADLNGLKLTNDVFGHHKGDELIRHAAEILSMCCEKSDIVARWGGDEFLLLLPNRNRASAQMLLERISSMCKAGPGNLEVSMAMGSATSDDQMTSFHDLLIKAEKQMYKNKIGYSKATKERMISSLVENPETKCFVVEGHKERLSKMAVLFADVVGISHDYTQMMRLGLLVQLHDIGKLSIPAEILGKPGRLTKEEWQVMKTHCEGGYRMAQAVGDPEIADFDFNIP